MRARKARGLKRAFVWLGGVIAACALVAGNLDHILSFGAKWLAPYLSPRASISIALNDGIGVTANVVIADEANPTRAIDTGAVASGQPVKLSVPANISYKIGWQGAGIAAGGASPIWAVKGGLSFRLVRAAQAGADGVTMTLRPVDAGAPQPAASEPSAKLLLTAHETQSPLLPLGALPELDRAMWVVGLFETGTSDCAHRLLWVRPNVPQVGCVDFSAAVITTLDGGDAHRLDGLVGDSAPLLRNYVAHPDAPADATAFHQAIERLVATPEYWIAYQAILVSKYAAAADAARQVGLVSARGRLLMFDHLILAGPARLSDAVRTYLDKYPPGASGGPGTEQARILAVGEILKAQLARGSRNANVTAKLAARIDTIVGGHGSVRGISFQLDQLGISDAS